MIILLFVCSVLVTSVAGQLAPTVTIKQGTVIGSVATDGNYFEFYGIPYAGSTSGENRFKAPLPAPTFVYPLEANRKDIKCVRAVGNGFEGTEDCLVANVFTPTLDTARRLSVMVWIKGKEFDQADRLSQIKTHRDVPELSFRNFVQKEVVVVSLNYRESILGFLCLGTETVPGNAGLKDIIAGLKWVKDNIAQFGGNPDDVTLFGHGSGAAAVDLVTMSPMGKGLVQKAISQSGNALAPWAVTRHTLKYAILVAEALGHQITSPQQLSDLFIRTSVPALMAVINALDLTDNSLAFAPCVERQELENVETFLSKTPSQIIRDAEFLPIPMIIGFVDNEGTIRSKEAIDNNWLERMENSFTDFIPSDLRFETDAEKIAVAQHIRQFYFQEKPINMANIGDYLSYHGDTMVLVPSIREVVKRISSFVSPIYLYQFSYSGILGEPYVGPIKVESAAHSEELAYMFYSTPVTGTPDKDQTVGNILVERWTNFAKTSVPTSETSQVSWPPVTRDNVNILRVLRASEIVNDTLEVSVQRPHEGKVSFWNSIYVDYFLDAESNWEIDELGTTPAVGSSPDDVTTPAGGSSPADITTPAGGSSPADITTPAGGSSPADITTPAGGSSPADITTPAGGSSPADITTPAGGSSPDDGTTPAGGSSPADITTPAGGSSPADITTAAGGSSPDDGTTPADGSSPADITTPAGGSSPDDGTTPAGGSSPADITTPAGGSSPDDGTTPAGGSTPDDGKSRSFFDIQMVLMIKSTI